MRAAAAQQPLPYRPTFTGIISKKMAYAVDFLSEANKKAIQSEDGAQIR
tara:strand:- start:85 stop:231 length:147 start_codon:yes stop_codon:yes gene_type:complete